MGYFIVKFRRGNLPLGHLGQVHFMAGRGRITTGFLRLNSVTKQDYDHF
jgi:hypothetical protein